MPSDRTNSVSIGRPPMQYFSITPSRNSMAMNACPSCSPMSWMVQMLGWFSADAALGFHGTPADAVLQHHPIQKLHGDERLPILLANVVDGTDVGVVQCGCGLGFALKAGECLRVAGNAFGQEFESDKPMKPRVLGLIHNAHAPTAELLSDAIMRDDLVDHGEVRELRVQW